MTASGTVTTHAVKCCAVIVKSLLTASPAHAGPCAQPIASVQAQLDSALEDRLRFAHRKSEGVDPLQRPSPVMDALFDYALDALIRARAADRAADFAKCHQALANARVHWRSNAETRRS